VIERSWRAAATSRRPVGWLRKAAKTAAAVEEDYREWIR
jgi:hypothetical protein